MVTQLFVTRKEQNGYMMLGIFDALAAVAILEKDGFGFLKRRLAGFLGSLACAFLIFVRLDIPQLFYPALNIHPRMIHPADS